MALFLWPVEINSSPWRQMELANHLVSWAAEWESIFPQDELVRLLENVESERQRDLVEIFSPVSNDLAAAFAPVSVNQTDFSGLSSKCLDIASISSAAAQPFYAFFCLIPS
ncbi:hypothetical protein XENOCAPTIV_021754 [Xenoophorus captivus]|uniref:Uncharacterized protein n=1 Tax=Xenoophorus captivus TaxID=1517983 RepID=A0ABV0SHC2_9TELE